MPENILVAAIDTDIGKTYLIEQIIKKFTNINVIKPIISGFNLEDKNNDLYKIIKNLNIEYNINNINKICPWRSSIAASPHIAIKDQINYDKLVAFCNNNIRQSKKDCKNLLIESAGGIMSPINNDKTFINLANDLNIKLILLTSNFLGSLSQTLCAIYALRQYKLKIHRVVVNNLAKGPNSMMSDDNFIEYITNYCKIKPIKIANYLKNPLDL